MIQLPGFRYKIPVAPANYQSQIVESLRASVNSMPEPVGHNGPAGAAGDGGWGAGGLGAAKVVLIMFFIVK